MLVADLSTPALVVDATSFEHNVVTMAAALPRHRLRPHVKAHKCTEIARRQLAAGHEAFTCATPREVVGMASAGLGADLLLANETVDPTRLRAMAEADARVTVAVDSEATIEAAAHAGIEEVVIDVDVGLPRCGCSVDDAPRLSGLATNRGLAVRGVMGYEGHAVGLEDRDERTRLCDESMTKLRAAHEGVGGDVVSAGGTGTYDINDTATEIQAGSYALLDTAYAAIVPEFRLALRVVGTVISVSGTRAVADVGLKALAMDHGNPTMVSGDVWFCSDEHITFAPGEPLSVGDRVLVQPAHVDPTIALHDRLFVASGPSLDDAVIDEWSVDLRGW